MIPQTTTIDYALVQSIENQPILTTLTKFSNSETLETIYNIMSNTHINLSNEDDDDNYNLKPKTKSINVVMKITNISKKTPIIDIDEFEELEE